MSNATNRGASILREDDPSTWEIAWQSEAALRAEFRDNKDVFLASMRNRDKGRLYGSRSDFARGEPGE